MTFSLQLVRSALFLPASNPRAIGHALESAADLVILDLEDSVSPGDKGAARSAAVDAAARQSPMPIAIRINAIGSEWHSLDVDSVARSNARFVVLPSAGSAHLVHEVAEAVGKPLLAMIESAAGVIAAADIAREAAALIAGTNDLSADLKLPPGAGRQPLQTALQTIVLAARASGIAPFDGVFNSLDDPDGLEAECAEGRSLGFDGKTLIHPKQIDPCNRAFSPGKEEIARARRLVEAYGGGAVRFEGQMIERMHVDVAERLLQRSGTA